MNNITVLPPDLTTLAQLRLLLRDTRAKVRNLTKEILALKNAVRELKKNKLDLEFKIKTLEEKANSPKQSIHRRSPNWRVI